MIKKSELDQLVGEDIISSDQLQSILDFQLQEKSKQHGFSQSIVTIGSVLIALGVFSLIALNREGMGDLLKTGIMLLGIIVTYFLGWYFKEKQRTIIGGMLLFLSGLFVGATIFLIAQVYNLTVSNDVLLGVWLLFILPLVYILKQKEFYYLYFILLSCIVGQFFLSHSFQLSDARTIPVTYIVFGIFLLLVGYVHEYFSFNELLTKLYKIFAVNISMIAYFAFIVMSDGGEGYLFPNLLLWIIALLLLGYLFIYLSRKKKELLWILCASILLFASLAIHDVIIIHYCIFILLCLLVMYIGYTRDNNTVIKVANIYLYIFLMYLYGKYGREYENKALFFVFGGVVMIALGVGFNKVNSLVSTFLSHKETNE